MRMVVAALVVLAGAAAPGAGPSPSAPITISGDRFAVDGTPTFLFMVSMFDAVREAAAIERLRADLDFLRNDVKANGIRVFPNWWNYASGRPEPSGDALFDPARPGALRPAVLSRLVTVLDEAAARGLVVDVTFTRETFKKPDGTFMNVPEYKTSLLAAAATLARHSNAIVDVQNEYNCNNPGQHLSDQEAEDIVAAVRAAHPGLPVAASVACAISPARAGEIAARGSFAFVAFHDDRADGRWHTSARIESEMSALRSGVEHRRIPLYFQEPERWDHAPTAAHFAGAAAAARRHGAAAWTFHTRAGFDLSSATFRSRLDRSELGALRAVRGRIGAARQ